MRALRTYSAGAGLALNSSAETLGTEGSAPSFPIAAVVGGFVAGVAAISVLLLCIWMIRRIRRVKKTKTNDVVLLQTAPLDPCKTDSDTESHDRHSLVDISAIVGMDEGAGQASPSVTAFVGSLDEPRISDIGRSPTLSSAKSFTHTLSSGTTMVRTSAKMRYGEKQIIQADVTSAALSQTSVVASVREVKPAVTHDTTSWGGITMGLGRMTSTGPASSKSSAIFSRDGTAKDSFFRGWSVKTSGTATTNATVVAELHNKTSVSSSKLEIVVVLALSHGMLSLRYPRQFRCTGCTLTSPAQK
ncbi:hypothetical protein M427DRAFT_162628 [Gonapodya prolifera JEL478]|uniref:Uncharacterized protein n=1 Tax=Gonapodya prolifera (strain JEL478) TaxID=1344416 RepID=A0A139AZ96_GONPJ|nr:hypothetical protein M427DRAFT_162628 [Gonapodya prolifera JEL478]|eukprot:KXS22037.1 hypothetical protein M427DRAFT_162628 [Gonapodya prolifera JEL478]